MFKILFSTCLSVQYWNKVDHYILTCCWSALLYTFTFTKLFVDYFSVSIPVNISCVNNDRLAPSLPAVITFFHPAGLRYNTKCSAGGVGPFVLALTLATGLQYLTTGYEISCHRFWKFPSVFGFLTFRKILSMRINWDTLKWRTLVEKMHH